MSKFSMDYVIDNLIEYGDYFNSERALPSIYDGLKPSQRKILFAAKTLGLKSTGKYKKVVNLVGATMPIYTHGEASLGGAIIRMGQDFKMTYPVLDIQGNVGAQSNLSASDAGAASPRYIETRLTKIGEELLDSISNGTAKMTKNFDGTVSEPEHLFIPVPAFLLFNQRGIGVGTATSVPSFKLSSVIASVEALIQNPTLSTEELAEILEPFYIQEATVVNKNDLRQVYAHKPRDNKKASIKLRATFTRKGNELIITNFPYDAYPTKIVEQIEAKLETVPIFKQIVRAQDITQLDEKTKKEKVKMSLVLKASVDEEELIRALCENTSLQSYASVNMVLLDRNNHPKEYSIHEALLEWIEIYKEKTVDNLSAKKSSLLSEIEVLQGLLKALSEIDIIIELIKKSESKNAASGAIQARGYTEKQALAILDMKLSRLAKLEKQELTLKEESKQKELLEIQEVLDSKEKIQVLMSQNSKGYLKQDVSGKCKIEQSEYVKVKIEKNDKFYVSFDKKGNARISETKPTGKNNEGTSQNPVYLLAENSIVVVKNAKDTVVCGVFGVLEGEQILHFSEDGYVKKTLKRDLLTSRTAVATKQESVVSVLQTNSNELVLLKTKKGKQIIFETDEVPSTGRGAKGVVAVKLDAGDKVASVEITPKRIASIPYGRNKKPK